MLHLKRLHFYEARLSAHEAFCGIAAKYEAPHGLKGGYVTRILSLNSLAPDIVEALLAGIEPDGLSIAKLTEQPIPEDWNEQRRLYGFPERGPYHHHRLNFSGGDF